MKVRIINSDMVNGESVPRPRKNWEYEGNPQSPQLSDGNTYTYHPAGISGPELIGHTDDIDERQAESDENWVKIAAPAARLSTAKRQKIQSLKLEAVKQLEDILDIPPNAPDWYAISLFKVLQMVDNSYQRNPPLDPDLIAMGRVRGAFNKARLDIKALTTEAEVETFDVTKINWNS